MLKASSRPAPSPATDAEGSSPAGADTLEQGEPPTPAMWAPVPSKGQAGPYMPILDNWPPQEEEALVPTPAPEPLRAVGEAPMLEAEAPVSIVAPILPGGRLSVFSKQAPAPAPRRHGKLQARGIAPAQFLPRVGTPSNYITTHRAPIAAPVLAPAPAPLPGVMTGAGPVPAPEPMPELGPEAVAASPTKSASGTGEGAGPVGELPDVSWPAAGPATVLRLNPPEEVASRAKGQPAWTGAPAESGVPTKSASAPWGVEEEGPALCTDDPPPPGSYSCWQQVSTA